MKIALNEFQIKEISKFWFDLSKFTFISLILKFFEPQSPAFTFGSIGAVFLGLILVCIFAIVGMLFSRKVKK